jgi:hypothetical protein
VSPSRTWNTAYQKALYELPMIPLVVIPQKTSSPRPSLSYSFCYRSCQLCHHSWPFMSFMVVYASSSGLIQSEIHVISCNLVQFMQFLEMHDIHVKSYHSGQFMAYMSIHSIHDINVNSCQFMSIHSIHVI